MTEQECQEVLAEPHIGLLSVVSHGDQVFRPFFTNGRAVDAIGNVWSFFDLTPLGYQET